MTSGEACCPAAAARLITKLDIGGHMIGISALDIILRDASEGTGGKEELGRNLLRLTKIYNYVPRGMEGEYIRALLEEYHRNEQESE